MRRSWRVRARGRYTLPTSALTLRNVNVYYGDSHVLRDISLELGEGRVLGLLGRNGAGKSTCVNAVAGLLPPRRGVVEIFGKDTTNLPPEAIAARGMGLVPQGRRIFRSLTVRENLVVAARKPVTGKHGPWSLDAILTMFPRLSERSSQTAGQLSGGEQQMLAIGRALMGSPRVLLMDEPSEGLAPRIVAEVMSIVRGLKESGLSIVLVEQSPTLVLGLADDIAVLNTGRVAVSGAAAQLKDRLDEVTQHLGLF